MRLKEDFKTGERLVWIAPDYGPTSREWARARPNDPQKTKRSKAISRKDLNFLVCQEKYERYMKEFEKSHTGPTPGELKEAKTKIYRRIGKEISLSSRYVKNLLSS
jgi:hypothetical protein